jgi:alpha-L-fucosidase 2
LDETPQLAAAARRSLEMRGDKATGWATAWRINLWARLREGDRAHGILKFLLGPDRTYPNMFDAHPPFQIDGNFGGTAAIAEMLVQSRGEDIFLLPALPAAWPDGSIIGLRTRGSTMIDLSWKDGRFSTATIVCTASSVKMVRYGGHTIQLRLRAGRPRKLNANEITAG